MANWRLLLCAAVGALANLCSSAQELTRITQPLYPPFTGAGYSPRISLNSTSVVFASHSRLTFIENLIGRRNMNVYAQNRLLSVTPSGLPGNGDSYAPEISANGRFVLFESSASDLVTNDYNGAIDLFRRDLVSNETMLVSARPIQPPNSLPTTSHSGNGHSTHGMMSVDGNRVIFNSRAVDLVSASDMNYETDVFTRDCLSGVTTLISVSRNVIAPNTQTTGNAASRLAAISEDGNYVLFYSYATNLVATNFPSTPQVERLYLRDVIGRTTEFISRSPTNQHGFGVTAAVMNRNASIVAFLSSSRLINPINPASQTNIFYRILPTQELISIPLPREIHTNLTGARMFLSPGGSRLALSVPGVVTNSLTGEVRPPRLLLWDLFAESLEELDLSAYGPAGISAFSVRFISPSHLMVGPLMKSPQFPQNTNTFGEGVVVEPIPSEDFSANIDGSWLAYQTFNTNGLAAPTVHVKRAGGFATPITQIRDGADDFGGDLRVHTLPNLPTNPDRFVFTSASSILVDHDSNGFQDIFFWDRTNNMVSMVASGNGPSFDPAISADGKWIAFISAANNFVANDTNRTEDVFIKEANSSEFELISVEAVAKPLQPPGATRGTVISADGRYVAYSTMRDDLVEGLTRNREHLLVRDRAQGVTLWVSQSLETNTAFRAKPLAIFGSDLWFRNRTNVFRYNLSNQTMTFVGRSDIDPTFSPSGQLAGMRARIGPTNYFQLFDSQSDVLTNLYVLETNRAYSSRMSVNNSGDLAFVIEHKGLAADTDATNDIYIASPNRALTLATAYASPNSTEIIEEPLYNQSGSRLYYRDLTLGSLPSVRAERPPPIANFYYTQFSNGHPAFTQFVASGPATMRGIRLGDGIVLAGEDLYFHTIGPIAPDSDGDGLLDLWEREALHSLDYDGPGDFDGDGSSNYAEYLAGTDPRSYVSALRVSIEPWGGSLKISYPKPENAAAQIQFRSSLDSGEWSHFSFFAGPPTEASDGTVSHIFNPNGLPTYFFKLELLP